MDDENLPIPLFPKSLEGDALDWYSNLKSEEMTTWLDLSIVFVRQYKYNCELALRGSQDMCKTMEKISC